MKLHVLLVMVSVFSLGFLVEVSPNGDAYHSSESWQPPFISQSLLQQLDLRSQPLLSLHNSDLIWTTRASMPTARFGLGVGSSSNKLYAIGGTWYNGEFGTAIATVEEYNPATDTWRARAGMPTPRTVLGIGNGNAGKLYVIGGNDDNDRIEALTAVEEYEPSTNSWAKRASMPTPRYALGVVTASNGKIYAIGGNQPFVGYHAAVEEYDPNTNTWRSRASLPAPRAEIGVAAAPNGKVYVVGGRDADGNILSTVEEYDPARNIWIRRANIPTPRSDLEVVTANNGKLYAIGGLGSNGRPLAIVEEYDPVTDTWSTRASMSTARWALGAEIASNGKLYAIGGWDTTRSYPESFLTTVEEATIQDAPASICGRLIIGTACTSGTAPTFPLFLPCGSDTAYLWQGGPFVPPPGAYFRVYDPMFQTMDPLCTRECSNVTNRLVNWSRYEPIGDCAACGASEPTPCTPFGEANLRVSRSSFTFTPAPVAFQPFSLTFSVENTGPRPFDPQDKSYKLEIKFIQPLGDTVTYHFDTAYDPSAARLSVRNLDRLDAASGPHSSMTITVRDLWFPSRIDNGAIEVKVIPRSEDSNLDDNGWTNSLSIGGFPVLGLVDCISAFTFATSKTVLDFASRGLIREGIGQFALEHVTESIVETVGTIAGLCLGSPNQLECVADQLAPLLGLIRPDKLFDALAFVLEVVFGFVRGSLGCLLEFERLALALAARMGGFGVRANGVALDSTVYALAMNDRGQRVGFLDNGTQVQEIPGASILRLEGAVFLLYPGTNTATVRVKGNTSGNANVIVTLAKSDTATQVEYLGLTVNPMMTGTLNAADERYLMAVDQNGDGSIDMMQAPNSITVTRLHYVYLPNIAKGRPRSEQSK